MDISKKKLALAVSGIILIFLIFWVATHGKIEVSVANPGSGEFTYSLVAQNSQKVTQIKSNRGKISRYVGSGSYEVQASQGNTNYFEVVKAPSFLGTVHISAKLAPEKQRIFVGDNPAPCLFFSDKLFSYECSSPYNGISLHVPATASQPTFVTKLPPSGAEGLVEGIIKTGEGNVALLHPFDAEGPGGHILYLLDNDLKPLKPIGAQALDAGTDYSLTSYKEGFLVYSADYSKVFYYSSLSSAATAIDVPRPSATALKPVSLQASAQSIAVTYSDFDPTTANDSANASAKANSEIVVFDGNTSSRLTINRKLINAAMPCSGRICVLSGKTMSVYAPNGKSYALAYSVTGVNSMETAGTSLLLARDKDVLQFDAASRSGAPDYTFGSYSPCGVRRVDANSYVLCVINGNKKSALLINRSKSDEDSIDKKVSELRKTPEASDISINFGYIYVSPNLGELTYDKATGSYGYDAAVRKRVNDKINQKITDLKINKTRYQVINPYN
jgi:hypothetical protein